MTSTDGMAGNSEDAVAAAPPSPTTDGPEHAAHRATGNAGVPDAAAIATGTCARCATTTPQLTPATRVPGMSLPHRRCGCAHAGWDCAHHVRGCTGPPTPVVPRTSSLASPTVSPRSNPPTSSTHRASSGAEAVRSPLAVLGVPRCPRAQSKHCADAGASLMNGYESDCPTAVLVDRPSVAGRPVRADESPRAAHPRSRSASASWSRVVSNSSPHDASKLPDALLLEDEEDVDQVAAQCHDGAEGRLRCLAFAWDCVPGGLTVVPESIRRLDDRGPERSLGLPDDVVGTVVVFVCCRGRCREDPSVG